MRYLLLLASLTAAACGGGGGGNATCAPLGSRPCPMDDPVTQYAVDICKQCLPELQANDSCAGTSGAGCDANGKSKIITATANCQSQFTALYNCYKAGLPTDGGAGDGG